MARKPAEYSAQGEGDVKARIAYIYGLVDPLVGQIRYIGRSLDPLARFKQHLTEVRKPTGDWRGEYNSAKRRWLQDLASAEKQPRLIILETTDAAHAHQVERAIIHSYIAVAVPLLNIQSGKEPKSPLKEYTIAERDAWKEREYMCKCVQCGEMYKDYLKRVSCPVCR